MILPLSSYAFKTTPGPLFKVNEDALEINLANNIFIIMDGFGGAGIGDVAVKQITSKILEFYTSSSSDPDATLPYFFDPKYPIELNVLVNSIHHVHKEFIKENLSKSIDLRAGASFVVGVYVDKLFMTISLGNCSSMLRRKGKFFYLTRPDTLFDSAVTNAESAVSLFPSNAFGLYNKLDIKISELKVLSGDQIVLCTDGVYAYQTLEEMNYILSKNYLSNSEKINETIDLANLRGNWDNQSIILLNF